MKKKNGKVDKNQCEVISCHMLFVSIKNFIKFKKGSSFLYRFGFPLVGQQGLYCIIVQMSPTEQESETDLTHNSSMV